MGRLRRSVIKDLKLEEFGLELIAPDVRLFAPQPDGSAVTFWSDAATTAEGLKPRHAHDADAFGVRQEVRAIASFLAYINVITPPDARSPSIADAFMGLKLGQAFRDLGAKTGREAIRALPMAVADLVPRSSRTKPSVDRSPPEAALHRDGTVGRGHGGGVPDGFRGQRRGSAGQARREGRQRRPGEALGRARRLRRDIRTGAEVTEIRSRDGRVVGVTWPMAPIDAAPVVSAADPKRTLRSATPSS